MFTVIVILGLAWLIIYPIWYSKHEKNQERIERSTTNTKVEDYLWLIRLLKSKGFNLKEKSGLNTPHVILTFEGQNGKIVSIDHDYTALDKHQGKLYLVSGDKRLRTYFFRSDERERDIEQWLGTL